jgi:hypothetical protein
VLAAHCLLLLTHFLPLQHLRAQLCGGVVERA